MLFITHLSLYLRNAAFKALLRSGSSWEATKATQNCIWETISSFIWNNANMNRCAPSRIPWGQKVKDKQVWTFYTWLLFFAVEVKIMINGYKALRVLLQKVFNSLVTWSWFWTQTMENRSGFGWTIRFDRCIKVFWTLYHWNFTSTEVWRRRALIERYNLLHMVFKVFWW